MTSRTFTKTAAPDWLMAFWGEIEVCRPLPYAFTEQGVAMLSSVLSTVHAGERTPAPWLSSVMRPRTHPVLLQKIYEAAHLRQEQAVAQG